MTLLDNLKAELHQNGAMPFVEFMQQALYTPELGYYCAGAHPFGVGGDFVTAPMLTPLFGWTLANQCQEVITHLTDPILFEFGAGTGQLCVDLLTALERRNRLPREYHILEVSGHLQRQQHEWITTKIPHLAHRVKWLSRWPAAPFSGVIIANEVLDAMPVHRFVQTKDGLLESYIALNAAGALYEIYQPCAHPRLIAHIQAVLSADMCPYQSEANLFIDGWLRQCFNMLTEGALFLVDYGFPRHEYYHPDRHGGTLMCHYKHQAHTNPLLHVGQQDITAHVDFTHVAEAGHAAGFHVAGYTNQASFLLANGLLSLLSEVSDERERINSQQAVKQLIQPNEMGELFKVMALTKKLEVSLSGFQLQDKRVSL